MVDSIGVSPASYPGVTASVGLVSEKLVQRSNFVALKKGDFWEYYSIKVNLEQVADDSKIVDIDRYKGPCGEGVVILRSGVCFLVAPQDLSRMRLLRLKKTTLRELTKNDTSRDYSTLESDLGRIIGPEHDEAAACKIIQDQVQAVHGITDPEEAWRL